MEEKIFFNEDGVSVSNSRFIVDGQTYAMTNVTSVKAGVIDPDIKGGASLAVISIIMLFGGDGGWFIAGLVLLAITIQIFKSYKRQFTVLLNSSSGENKALVSYDESFIKDVIDALNDAIVSRG